jgi:hypothetical protein
MVALIIPAIVSLLPWIAAWVALGGNVKSIEQNIEGFGAAITQGPISSATNAWVKVAVIAAGLGIGVWLLETKLAHNMGQELDAPPVSPIYVAHPPSFGTSGGYEANAGPVRVHAGVTSQGGGGGGGGYGEGGRPTRAVPKRLTVVKATSATPRRGGFSDERAA